MTENPYTQQFTFTKLNETMSSDEEYEIVKNLILTEVVLPDFCSTIEPKNPTFNLNINHDDTTQITVFFVEDEEGKPYGGTFSEIIEAYDYITNDLSGEVQFTGDVEKIFPEGKQLPIYKNRLLLESDPDLKEYLLKRSYYHFLTLADEYENNPNHFTTAWNFINRHPMFWANPSPNTHYWDTQSGIKQLDLEVYTNENNEPIFCFETGSNEDRDRKYASHDTRLDVYTDSYNKGIIEMAANIHNNFTITGEDKGKPYSYDK